MQPSQRVRATQSLAAFNPTTSFLKTPKAKKNPHLSPSVSTPWSNCAFLTAPANKSPTDEVHGLIFAVTLQQWFGKGGGDRCPDGKARQETLLPSADENGSLILILRGEQRNVKNNHCPSDRDKSEERRVSQAAGCSQPCEHGVIRGATVLQLLPWESFSAKCRIQPVALWERGWSVPGTGCGALPPLSHTTAKWTLTYSGQETHSLIVRFPEIQTAEIEHESRSLLKLSQGWQIKRVGDDDSLC